MIELSRYVIIRNVSMISDIIVTIIYYTNFG